ncbi:HPr family phosphocarrier protein [Candidatus Daviesbacteria bacterium]|nr:HPr family phosphocarrier protein [Candidatus Daviesbacteria bacterium]
MVEVPTQIQLPDQIDYTQLFQNINQYLELTNPKKQEPVKFFPEKIDYQQLFKNINDYLAQTKPVPEPVAVWRPGVPSQELLRRLEGRNNRGSLQDAVIALNTIPDNEKSAQVQRIKDLREVGRVRSKRKKNKGSISLVARAAAGLAAAVTIAHAVRPVETIVMPSPVEAHFSPLENTPQITHGIIKSDGAIVEVLSPTGYGKFLVKTEDGEFEMFIEDLDIEGDLFWEKELSREWLGFEASNAKQIDKMIQLGAGTVKISAEGADAVEAINKAKEKDLHVILVLDPGVPLSGGEIKNRVDRMLKMVNGYNKVSFVLGENMDLQPGWKGDLRRFAVFAIGAASSIKNQRPDAQIIIGPVSKAESVKKLIAAIRNYTTSSRFTYAIEAENLEDLEEKISAVTVEFGTLNPNFVVSGLRYGVAEKDGMQVSERYRGLKIREMVEIARKKGAAGVTIAQDTVTPDGKWARWVWQLIDYIWST